MIFHTIGISELHDVSAADLSISHHICQLFKNVTASVFVTSLPRVLQLYLKGFKKDSRSKDSRIQGFQIEILYCTITIVVSLRKM